MRPRNLQADLIQDTLSRLRPEDLGAVWRYVDSLERAGWLRGEKAFRWKSAIVDLMECLGLDQHWLLEWDQESSARDSGSTRPTLPN